MSQRKAKPKKRNTLKIMMPKDFEGLKPYTPAPLSLCSQLEDSILLLENRISNAITKINSLM